MDEKYSQYFNDVAENEPRARNAGEILRILVNILQKLINRSQVLDMSV